MQTHVCNDCLYVCILHDYLNNIIYFVYSRVKSSGFVTIV